MLSGLSQPLDRAAYLPDTLKDVRYYEFGDNKNEQAFRQYWENIKGKKL
ncbi:MAG: hypothetical protein ACLSCV_12655 [Acutalibacteraceae bacterium]